MKMTVKSTNGMKKLTNKLKELDAKSIEVGVFGSDDADMVMIARVHEYGMVIKPKNGKYLTIPATKEAKGKSARDFPNLFFVPTSNGNGLLARNKGKDQLEVLFVLVKSVTIPERSFIRSGYDENVDDIYNLIERLMPKLLSDGMQTKEFTNMVGQQFAGKIQKKIRSIKSPPNARLTVAAKGNNNPLQDTGHLIQSIDYKVK